MTDFASHSFWYHCSGWVHRQSNRDGEKVVEAVDATGIPSSISLAYWAKGEAFSATDPPIALQAYEHASAIARQSGNRFWEILVIPLKVAALQAKERQPVAALESFRQMLAASGRSADLMFASHGVGGLIVLLERLGQAKAAATLLGISHQHPISSAFFADFPETIARLRSELGDVKFEETRRKGSAMTQHEVADYALDEIRNALAALGVSEEASAIY